MLILNVEFRDSFKAWNLDFRALPAQFSISFCMQIPINFPYMMLIYHLNVKFIKILRLETVKFLYILRLEIEIFARYAHNFFQNQFASKYQLIFL